MTWDCKTGDPRGTGRPQLEHPLQFTCAMENTMEHVKNKHFVFLVIGNPSRCGPIVTIGKCVALHLQERMNSVLLNR